MNNIRTPHYRSEPYTDAELRLLERTFLNSESYAHNAASEFHRYRDLMIVTLACMIGTRPGETLNMEWSRFDWRGKEYLPNPMTNKQRETEPVILTNKAIKLLISWKKFSDKFVRCKWVFPSLQTFEPLTTSGYDKRLLSISKEAGIHKVVWHTQAGQPISNRRFYSARKRYGTKLHEKTGDLYIVMRGLRQTKVSSTLSYVRPSKELVRHSIESALR